MAAWRKCLLGDVVNLKRGYDLPQSARSPGIIPVVSSSGITDHHAEAKVKGPGVVTGRYGTLGQVFFVETDYWPLNTSLYVQDFKGNDPRFISYFLSTLSLGSQNAAGAVPGVNRNHLHALNVQVPPLSAQRRIAAILSAYDELIENSQRRITILESMARALYREWFVHFRFPGYKNHPRVASPLGEIPQGWETRPIKDVATVTYGFPFASQRFNTQGVGIPIVRIRDIPEGASQTFTDEDADPKYNIANGQILVGMDGDFHMCIWSAGQAVQNQRVARFDSNEEIGTLHLFFALEKPIREFNDAIVGTTVAHLGDMHIKTIRIVWPPSALREMARLQLDPMCDEMITLKRQIRNLRQTRAVLLPRLLSGQIDVGDA
jgi:type I restriction enzyme, S subunit